MHTWILGSLRVINATGKKVWEKTHLREMTYNGLFWFLRLEETELNWGESHTYRETQMGTIDIYIQ